MTGKIPQTTAKKVKNNAKPRVLGVVGARSGSKSIPNKNIKPLLGKPLMAWIIEAAKEASLIDRVVVSTDSEAYAAVARKYGAEIPFLRPAEISADDQPDITYLQHAVRWLEDHENWKPDIVLRLPPTSPLCTSESIDACIQLLIDDEDATSSRTITLAPKHPYKLWKIEGEELKPFIPKEITGFSEPSNSPRQGFIPAYMHVDAIAVRYDTLMRDNLLTGSRVRFREIPKDDAVDIDTELDFMVAEMLLQKKLKQP